tara:strand:+ start:87 stop:641 length:555 start_codon:yes stop_codon:yes gene_type:complete
VHTTDKVNKYLQALTDLEGNIELMKQKDLKLNQSDVLKFLISIEERVKLVSDLLAVHPEDMPTCDGCGGQKEHPTKQFSYPPQNGLCGMELDECEPLTDLFDEMSEYYGEHGLPAKCNEEMAEYYEGEPCPLCHKDYDEYADNSQFFSHSEGGGNDDYLQHYYCCPHCDGKWVNVMSFTTEEVN